MGVSADLEKLVPVGAQNLTGDGIAAPVIPVDAKALKQAKRNKFFNHILGLYRAFSNDDAVQLPGFIQDADGLITAREKTAVGVGISGVVRCDGKYFFIDGGGFYAFDDLCSHGVPCDERELSAVFRYAAKYMFKEIEAVPA